MPIEGYAELPQDGRIAGWVWNPAEPGRALHVEVFNGSTFYQRTVADLFREDLLQVGKRAGYCSFEVILPAGLEGELHVILDGTPHCLRVATSEASGLMMNWLDTEGLFLRPSLLVHRLTSSVLGRSATRLELLRSATQTGDVHALTRLARSIMASAPDLTVERSEEFLVDQVYLGVLTRTAEERGITMYSEALRGGMPLANLIRELIQTTEFARLYEPSRATTVDTSAEFKDLTRAVKAALVTLMLQAPSNNASTGG